MLSPRRHSSDSQSSSLTPPTPILSPLSPLSPTSSMSPALPEKRNPIIFPVTSEDSSGRQSSKSESHAKYYSARKLRTRIAHSPNANDHLSRIQVTTATYCTCAADEKPYEFIVFTVKDVAIPGIENTVILRQNSTAAKEQSRGLNESPTGRSVVKRSPLSHVKFYTGRSVLAPGLFLIPAAERQQDIFSDDVKRQDRLELSNATSSFPLENLIVLASTLSSPRYISHRLRMALHHSDSNFWFTQTLWAAMSSINTFQRSLDTDRPLANSNTNEHQQALATKVLRRFGKDLQNFRNGVIRFQNKKYTNQESRDQMRLALEKELEACNHDIAQQTESANRLAMQNNDLDRNRKELAQQYEGLHSRLGPNPGRQSSYASTN